MDRMKAMNEMHFAILRRHMVEVIGIHTDLIREELGNAVLDERILRVMLRIPRHLLMPEPFADVAYPDMPLPIGAQQDDFAAVDVCAYDGPPCS